MKSKSQELLDKSIAAMVSAIEIYNKPDFLYRGETFAILAINSWELFLKAKYLRINKNKIRSLFVFENPKNKDGSKSKKKIIKTTRSGNPFTHNLDFVAKKLIMLGEMEETVLKNIEALIELRDSAVHFYNYSLKFNVRIQEIGTATLRNYVSLFKKWFGKDLSEYNFYLMPLSFVSLDSVSDVLVLNTEEKNFFRFVDELEESETKKETDFSIALNLDINFTKSKSRDAIKVALSKDSDAIKITLSEEQIKEKYPFDYRQITDACKKRYSDFKENSKYHEIRKGYEIDDRYVYIRFLDPDKPKGSKKAFYSGELLNILDEHYIKKVSR